MKRFSFNTFRVDDTNHAAFDACHGAALLAAPPGKCPVLLVGPEGSGKTHLLYAVVNQVRAVSQKTGIAYITASDFPEQVRLLIHDPGPLERAPSAILLVDHLDEFTDNLADLEGVVRAFLDHGHAVIAASSAPPDTLTHFPEGLLALFRAAERIPLGPASPRRRAEALEERLDGETHAVIERQRNLIETLRAQVESAEGRLRETAALEAALAAARDRAVELEQEGEHLRAENALSVVATRVAGALRKQNEHLQERLDEALAQLQARPDRGEEVAALERELAEARAETERSKSEANGLLSRAEQLLDEVHKSRLRIAEAQEEQKLQVREIRQIEAVLAGEGFGRLTEGATGPPDPGGDRAATEARLFALEQAHARLEAEAARLNALLTSAESERDEARAGYAALNTMIGQANTGMDRLRAALAELRDENGSVREQLAASAEQLALAAADAANERADSERLREAMVQARSERESAKDQVRRRLDEIEALRCEVVEQQAEANARVRELEGRLEATAARLDEQGQRGNALTTLRETLAQASRTMDELLAHSPATSGPDAEAERGEKPREHAADSEAAGEEPMYFAGPRANGPQAGDMAGPAATGAGEPAESPGAHGTHGTPHAAAAGPVSADVRMGGQVSPRLIRRDEPARSIRSYTPRELPHGQYADRVPHGEPVLHHVEQFEDRLDLLGDESYGPMGRHGVEALHRLIHADDDPSI